MRELLGQRAGVVGRGVEEVLQAALGVVGQRIDAGDVLLGAGDPDRRTTLGQRARAAHRRDDEVAVGRHERGGQEPVGGQRTSSSIERSIVIGAAVSWLERLAPDVEHGVGADQRVAQRGGLLGVEALGVGAVVGLGEVDVARHPQQLVGAERGRRCHGAGGDIGLDRAEVAAAVEDDGDGLRQRQVAHAAAQPKRWPPGPRVRGAAGRRRYPSSVCQVPPCAS